MIFLPYSDQDRPPLNARSICVKIEAALDALSPDTEITSHGGRVGIMVSSPRVETQGELWNAVEPVLPAGLFGAERS